MGRLGKSPIDESGVYSGPKSPEISSVGQGLHPAPQGRTQRHTGADTGQSCALPIACRDEPDTQLLSLCLGSLPCSGEFQFRQLPLTVTVEGLSEG